MLKHLRQATVDNVAQGDELLVAGAATTGPPTIVFWGPFLAGILVMFGGDKVPALGLAGFAMLGSSALLAVLIFRSTSVALTNRRLIVFRSTFIRRRIKGVLRDVPRNQVFVQRFGKGLGWVTLVLGFHGTTGRPRMRLIFWTTFASDGESLHAALMRPQSNAAQPEVGDT